MLDNAANVRARAALPLLPAPALHLPHALSPRWRRTPQSMSGGAVKAIAHGKLEAWATKFKRAWLNCYRCTAYGALPRPNVRGNAGPTDWRQAREADDAPHGFAGLVPSRWASR